MNQNTPLYLKCFQLLQEVLLDAFHVSTLYLTPPYTDIDKIDLGMRAAVWTDYNTYDSRVHFRDISENYRILVVKSNLGFYNILLVMQAGDQPDFISIGPFRDDELSPNYFTRILKEAHISPADIQKMKHIYENMPYVHLDTIINVAKHIVGAYIPEYKDLEPKLLQYSEQKRAIDVNSLVLEQISIDESVQYRKLLFAFLDYLKKGDNVSAKKSLQHFLHETKLLGNKNMKDYKMILQVLNDYCHMALLQTSIHPLYVLQQATSTRLKIEDMTSLARLEQMPNEICHKYCLLVKNYANPEYSKLTKDVVAYIQLHLEEDLSLNSLASHFNKNPSVLSNSFSKETGQTLTTFVHQTRIHEAIRLFNTTNMSVSEVAMAVGYQDFSYFSKVFSKTVGCSPREYKQQR